MNFFLLPKEFTIPKVEKTSFILIDNNNTRLSVPIKFFACAEDIPDYCEDKISKNDLKVLADEINNALSNTNPLSSQSIFTMNDFFIKQNEDLHSIYKDNDHKSFPSITECLQSKDLVMEIDLTKLEFINQSNKYKPAKILFDEIFVFDLYYVKKFTTEFKKFRQYLGMTQIEVSRSMSYHLKCDFSQTTVCRFESMSLPLTNMFGLIPHFREWISKIYNPDKTITVCNVSKIENESHTSSTENESLQDGEEINVKSEDDESFHRKKRKNRRKRTVFTEHQIDRMEELFQTVKHSQITNLVYKKYTKELKITKKQIQSWFTKRRKRDHLCKINKK